MRSPIVVTGMVALFLGPLSPGSMDPPSLEATLHPGESVTETKCVTIPDLPPRVDVIFAFDLTGSMSGVIDQMKANAVTIMNNLAGSGSDFHFAVVSYMDYPATYGDDEENCGYLAEYGTASCGDYAYSLNQAMTDDTTAVSTAISGLPYGCGSDGPQDYTRIFYESYADPAVGWRAGAKRVLVNFADSVPHDCDTTAGWVPPDWYVPVYGVTGGDPGRDEIMNTADDLDLQTVLADMAVNNVTLLEAETGGDWTGGGWAYWTGITGGHVFDSTAGDFVTTITDEILTEVTVPEVLGLTIVAEAGWEEWLTSVVPPSYDVVLPGDTVCFDIVITVPEGTPEGDYEFTLSAVDEDEVAYGEQTVLIHVIVNQPPDCSGAYPSIARIWPPDHIWIPIEILGVTDPDGDPITITITAIWQDEPVEAISDGYFAPDGNGVGTSTAQVRAERCGSKKVPGNGRAYHISFTADDGRGGTCAGEVVVGVPHDVKDAVIDGGPLYDSTVVP